MFLYSTHNFSVNLSISQAFLLKMVPNSVLWSWSQHCKYTIYSFKLKSGTAYFDLITVYIFTQLINLFIYVYFTYSCSNLTTSLHNTVGDVWTFMYIFHLLIIISVHIMSYYSNLYMEIMLREFTWLMPHKI